MIFDFTITAQPYTFTSIRKKNKKNSSSHNAYINVWQIELRGTFHYAMCFLLYFQVYLSAIGGMFKVQATQLGSSILNV